MSRRNELIRRLLSGLTDSELDVLGRQDRQKDLLYGKEH